MCITHKQKQYKLCKITKKADKNDTPHPGKMNHDKNMSLLTGPICIICSQKQGPVLYWG